MQAKVVFSYTAEKDEEITKEGDIVDVITMETKQDGWWLVRYGIQEGLAPNMFLSIIPTALPTLTSNLKGMFLYIVFEYD